MNRLHYFLLLLLVPFLLGACTQDEDYVEDGPKIAESLVGLWYGESTGGMRNLMDLRIDRTGVYSSYQYMLHDLLSTSTFTGWTASEGLFVGGSLRGACRWNYLEMLDPSQRF